ncbi:MAG TPA: phosphoenolpyruvate--protein phosphotransferase [Bacteroidota bacterium]|nr:phosphoenolpyruvate--protein phosphotransferase [Bacteroidota bacterium]
MDGTPATGSEIVLRGVAAAPGISHGPAYIYSKVIPRVEQKQITPEEVPSEIARLRNANARSDKELQKIHAFAEQKLGSDNARIFEAQLMILADAILMGAIEGRIARELKNAEFIVADEITKYKQIMLASHDEYMHERAHDVDDVMNRIIRNIQDQKLFSRLEGASIIVSETLTPSDTVIFSRNQVLGYATDLGGITSHAAILARSLKIPAVVGLRTCTKTIATGDTIAIDGYAGVVVVNPGDDTLQALERKKERFRDFEERLVTIAPLTAETPDRKRIELSANIEFDTELEFARTQGSAGIGLFRTESQLIGRATYPSEEEQFAVYERVAGGVFPHSVIFRAFDVGGDKLSPDAEHEANPFLGWRGIRVLLDRPELFLDQIRGILRASTRKNVRIMFPMVSTLAELRRAREMVARAKQELDARNVPYDPAIKIGVMIEVPAAAVLAEQIAAESDFLSIGTNDLIQYLLAVDRDNAAVAPLYQQFNPAVLRTIKNIIDAGHRRGVWVGMCGEMAGDPFATVLLVGMGIDELSVLPSVLPEIKKVILSVRFKDAKRVADRVLAMSTEQEIRDHLSSITRDKVPEIPLDE